jgi:membrane protease YdiL (CAAX protease family)
MLFAVKRRLAPTLLTLAVLAGLAVGLRSAGGLRWRLEPYPWLPAHALLALGGMLVCDGIIYGALCRLFGDRYRACQLRLADYYAGQRAPAILAGGLLAVTEELLFRGTLLEALLHRAGLSPAAAILLSALPFGALHLLPSLRLAPFALWAVVQGVILGSLYIDSGSLLLVMLVHAAHDITGFLLLAWQRRRDAKVKGNPAHRGEVGGGGR